MTQSHVDIVSLQVKADEKTRVFLEAFKSQQMQTDVSGFHLLIFHCNTHRCIQAEETKRKDAQTRVDELVADIIKFSQDAANNGLLDKEKYVIPQHLHDLQEADLPETQRGLVMSEIAQFRERAAKREREKMRDVRESIPTILNAPSGPKQREWGRPAGGRQESATPNKPQGFGKGPQSYQKPVGFVKADDPNAGKDPLKDEKPVNKSDEELEAERKEQRRQEEELSFRDVSWVIYFDKTILHYFTEGEEV